jgi:signal transduction histidine kinase
MADVERLAFEQMLVHNLKAPLTGIMASLEMLSDGDLGALNAVQHDAVSAMQAQGAELVRMIDELLELGRTRSSAFTVQAVPLDLPAFLHDIRAEWNLRLSRLTIAVAPDVPDVVADAHVLRRVFENLLMNVLIHGPGRGRDAQCRTVGRRCADHGGGRWSRRAGRTWSASSILSSRSAARRHRTHGLGLAYCRVALTAMDGTIALVPADRGATFVVELPSAIVLTRQALEQDQ